MVLRSNDKLIGKFTNDLDLNLIVAAIWQRRWVISIVTAILTILTTIVVLLLPNQYTAHVLLAPSQSNPATQLGNIMSQYGGLARLAGFDVGDAVADRTNLGMAVLESQKFFAEFVDRHNALVPIMAAGKWDSESGRLTIDKDKYDVERGIWVRDVDPPRTPKPSIQEAYEVFQGMLAVQQDNKTGFITLSLTHESPLLVKQWLDEIVDDLNESMADSEVNRAKRAIDFLNLQLNSTSVAGLQTALSNLIEEQMKTVMLAESSDEFAFMVVDPPTVPELPSKPKRLLIVAFVFCASLLLSTLSVLALRRG